MTKEKSMKKLIICGMVLMTSLAFTSCDSFLDTLPDNRAEVNNETKITNLLVSAYPQSYPVVLWEMSSDNVMDNGSMYGVENKATEDAYLWKEITYTATDSPQSLWNHCYMSIAAANQALQAIEELGGGERLNPQKGEALMCRAFAHFILANTFCEAYNPNTADSKLGIPYATKLEDEVAPQYSRGTLAETYQNIEKDLQQALPLIDDNLYKVSKYHFNKKAAYAFAARFYLFYVQQDKSNYDKVITYANAVLGSDPTKMVRNYENELGMYDNPSNLADAYINAKTSANLMLQSIYSNWPTIYGPTIVNQRYGMAREICEGETLWAPGVWGSATNLFYESLNGMTQKLSFPKYGSYMEYTDKQNGVGYMHTVIDVFTAEETLLCRAEAEIMKGTAYYEQAAADLNVWVKAHAASPEKVSEYTWRQYVNYYTNLNYSSESTRTPKKKLNHPLFTLDSYQENFIHALLHIRRMECIHSGMRWLDVKRWGIEITHNREGQSSDQLTKNDLRRAIQLPLDVISSGLEANPR